MRTSRARWARSAPPWAPPRSISSPPSSPRTPTKKARPWCCGSTRRSPNRCAPISRPPWAPARSRWSTCSDVAVRCRVVRRAWARGPAWCGYATLLRARFARTEFRRGARSVVRIRPGVPRPGGIRTNTVPAAATPGPPAAARSARGTSYPESVVVMKLAVIPGDGIGPEVVAEALKVLDVVLPGVERTEYDLGAKRYHATGEILPESVLPELKQHDAILLGAIGDPSVPSGVLERGLLLH